MSVEDIFYEVLHTFSHQHIPEVSQRDVLAALEAGRPGPLAALYDAGTEAGLPRRKLLTRAAAIYFNFCTGNLADDLSDNECTYLSEPARTGPCTQYLLHSLFFRTLAAAELSSPTLSAVTQELIEAAGRQFTELHTCHWTAPVFRTVAEGIAGRQWAAYLQILWCDTALADRAARIGMNAGIAAHIVADIQSQDPRYTTLPEADKHEIVTWALATAEALREEKLDCIDAVLRGMDPVLKEAL